ncbi:MAG TPA: bifunctional riboflavin kinase/FAD synthetase [Acidimicrobiales bacterium]
MEVLRDPSACRPPSGGSAVTIGFFDGVHLGHQVVIGEVRRLAAELGAESAVVTFDPHPASVVRPESAPALLTDLDQRLELLAATGVDRTLVVPFDEARSKESAEDFVEDVLVGCLGARAVVVGADFHFGHQRRGDVELLRRMGERHGFEVDGIQLHASGLPGARAVSSTAIREALVAGDVTGAARMLGRLHEVRGVVTRGDGRGRELGFPTANLAIPESVALPAEGVYAARYVRPGGSAHPAAVSLGRRPQFYEEGGLLLLEAYLLDRPADGDWWELYDEVGAVQFVERIRGQARFDSVEELVARMAIDVGEAARLLA